MGCTGSSAMSTASSKNTKPTQIQLEYFPLLGRAEPIRMLCSSQDIKYEDVSFTTPQWREMKGKTHYTTGGLPHCIIEGKRT